VSCRVVSCRVVPCRAVPCRVVSWLTISCWVPEEHEAGEQVWLAAVVADVPLAGAEGDITELGADAALHGQQVGNDVLHALPLVVLVDRVRFSVHVVVVVVGVVEVVFLSTATSFLCLFSPLPSQSVVLLTHLCGMSDEPHACVRVLCCACGVARVHVRS